jgi:hypothetical protein
MNVPARMLLPGAGARRLWLAVSLACALLLAGAQAARADLFGPIELASASDPAGGAYEQAGEARFPVISGDGRYVAFVGTFGETAGIWRRDLQTGEVSFVAPEPATLPSISPEGRYVSFTTNARLVAQDSNESPDVYVRDMEPGPGEPEYILASAVNGSEEAATYEEFPEPAPAQYGSLASARSAISVREGTVKVAFVTTAKSNLLGGSTPTPPLEVLVRDLNTDQTQLVSAEYQPGAGWSDTPVQPDGGFGAVFPGGANHIPKFATFEGEPPGSDKGNKGGQNETMWVGASISADGNAVTWMGQDLGRQARLLAHEQGTENPEIAEPLWRNIEEPDAPIRRVTGGSDPEAPGCAASGEGEISEVAPPPSDPCAGPFAHLIPEAAVSEGLWGERVRADFVPQISADGMRVAFLTGARELSIGEAEFEDAEITDDLYVSDMEGGLSRVQALRRLTELDGVGTNLERSAPIIDFGISPSGGEVAFTTQRTIFELGSPAFVSPIAPSAGMRELFDADLENDTVTRVTHGYRGEDERGEQLPVEEQPGVDPYQREQGSYAPSFDDEGNTLCFASTANNLVFGDGNDAADAFVVHRVPPPSEQVTQFVSPTPANPVAAVPWKLSLSAVSLANGDVRLYADTPGAGELSAEALGSVLVSVRASGARRRAHRSRRARVTSLVTRDLASAKTGVAADQEGLAVLTLTLSPAYRALASASGGQPARVSVTFAAPGHPALHATVLVTFRRSERSTGHSARRASKPHRGGA